MFKRFIIENEIEIDKKLKAKISNKFVDFYLNKNYIFRLTYSEVENILKNMKDKDLHGK